MSSAPDTVHELRPSDTGRWEVVTRNGTRHTFDLDARTYSRHPGEGRGSFEYDDVALHLTQVGTWPAVGRPFVVWFYDPQRPWRELWRKSSNVESITRLLDSVTD